MPNMPESKPGKLALESDPESARRALADGSLLLDIRPEAERQSGSPDSAIVTGPDVLSALERLEVERDARFYLICARGVRSLKWATQLRALGYRRATSVAGGFAAWLEQDLPAHFANGLTAREAVRYARHLVMPEIGAGGQRALLDASMLLVGAGGLGSPAAQYLAAAGVGRIGIVDDDRVERSNLQRQVLHDDACIGNRKADSAAARLKALNPDIDVQAMCTRLDRHNVEDLLPGWDVVIDGSDNFPTRYLVNDACFRHAIPLVYGAVMRFEGQASVFWPAADRGMNPCYRCLFPEPPSATEAPDCETAGVLGVLPGIIGTLQAAEALKIVLGIGEPLVGRLLRIEALDMRITVSRLPADPDCRLCAPGADFPGYADYEDFCTA
jgi:molybdopterin/thiamine biosynthesis adenylyltransferase/rhodanese-related sulfurtransferase